MLVKLFVATLLVSIWTIDADALPYRCNGYVQQRPCDQPFSLEDNSNRFETIVRAASPFTKITAKKKASATAATIISPSFKKISQRFGLWQGHVAGSGPLELHLLIYRNGMVESKRYIGAVTLENREKPISFNYRSYLPEGKGWSWRVLIAKQ